MDVVGRAGSFSRIRVGNGRVLDKALVLVRLGLRFEAKTLPVKSRKPTGGRWQASPPQKGRKGS